MLWNYTQYGHFEGCTVCVCSFQRHSLKCNVIYFLCIRTVSYLLYNNNVDNNYKKNNNNITIIIIVIINNVSSLYFPSILNRLLYQDYTKLSSDMRRVKYCFKSIVCFFLPSLFLFFNSWLVNMHQWFLSIFPNKLQK